MYAKILEYLIKSSNKLILCFNKYKICFFVCQLTLRGLIRAGYVYLSQLSLKEALKLLNLLETKSRIHKLWHFISEPLLTFVQYIT